MAPYACFMNIGSFQVTCSALCVYFSWIWVEWQDLTFKEKWTLHFSNTVLEADDPDHEGPVAVTLPGGSHRGVHCWEPRYFCLRFEARTSQDSLLHGSVLPMQSRWVRQKKIPTSEATRKHSRDRWPVLLFVGGNVNWRWRVQVGAENWTWLMSHWETC